MSYQGYKNHSTWAASLWIDNDEGLYDMMRERASELAEEYAGNVDKVRVELAGFVDEIVSDNAPDLGASMYADLLLAAMQDINRFEVAEQYAHEACAEYISLLEDGEEIDSENEGLGV